jgi:uncharacterized protein (DUF1778 family)
MRAMAEKRRRSVPALAKSARSVHTSTRSARMELRATPEEDELIRQAAALSGHTVTRFVLEAAVDRAAELIDEHQRDLLIPAEVYEQFIAELDRPAEPVPELVDLFSRPSRIERR